VRQGDWLGHVRMHLDRDIVNACDLLLVAPKEVLLPDSFLNAGGTWYTYNYAVKTQTNAIIVFPNGDTEVITYD
jgi:hypothetical protein